MTNLRADLQQSLGATYVIDRELAGGAMSRVFAATDVALNRRVVSKVLPPDVGEGVNLEATFQRMPVRAMPPSRRAYLDVAQLYAMAGRPDRSRALLAQYDAETTDSALIRRNRGQRAVVRGEIALAEHQPREALRHFAQSDFNDDGPSDPCGICTDMRLARAFDRANQPDSAIVYYERFVTTPYALRIRDDALYLPRTYRRLGELYELRGDRTTAAKYYARFIDLWDQADPELQNQVAEDRRRLARLNDVSRVSERAITRARQ